MSPKNDPKPKKSSKLRTIFLVLLGLLVIGIIFGGRSNKDTENGGKKITESFEDKSSQTSKNKAVKFYKIGDSVKVGDVTYKLLSVQKTDYRNQFESSKPSNVIEVRYHVINNSDEDISVGHDAEAYGSDNNKLESYPIKDVTWDSIAPGKEIDVIKGFGLNVLGDVEIHFSPFLSFEKSAKYKVNIQ